MRVVVVLALAAIALVIIGSSGTRPLCEGPCNLSLTQLLVMAGVCVAGVAVFRLVLLAVRRLRGAGSSKAAYLVAGLVAFVPTVGALVQLANAQSQRPGINVGHRGMTESDPFYLSGDYSLTWRAQTVTQVDCRLDVSLGRFGGGAPSIELVSTAISPGPGTSGTTSVSGLEEAKYYLEADSDCEWLMSFSPE